MSVKNETILAVTAYECLLKLINVGSVFESRAVLSTLDVLNTATAVICYCNKTRSLALALNIKCLDHINYDLLIPLYSTKARLGLSYA